jgi:thiol-disulfide isomerase/thioredoxin
MKTSIWFTVFCLFLALVSFSQDKNKKIIDERFEKEILIGHCDRAGLSEGDFGIVFKEEYTAYKPHKKYIKKLKKLDRDYVIVLVLGTWCHDSQMQVPRFYRVLDEAGIPASLMNVICVDGYKKCEDVAIDNYDIEFVPTFIFYRNGKEAGRIIESPEATLEEDFFSIIS